MADAPKVWPKRLLGCGVVGSIGVISTLVVIALLVGVLGSSLSSCEIGPIGSPGDGTASKRLEVQVSETTSLEPGQVVTVTSTAFEPSTVVGIAVCLQAADTQRRGVEACDENQGYRYPTDATGRLQATFPVPRVITVADKAFDCAAETKRCLVVAADANDYDQSGGQPISFATNLPTPDVTPGGPRPISDHLPVGAQPSGPVAPGAALSLLATGFQPGEPVLVAWCTDQLDADGMVETCEPQDVQAAGLAIMFRSLSDAAPTANDSGAVVLTVVAPRTITPFGNDLSKAINTLSSTTVAPTGSTTTTGVPPTGDVLAPQTAGTGTVDCAARPGRCAIVIAAAADTRRSAVLPYTLTPR